MFNKNYNFLRILGILVQWFSLKGTPSARNWISMRIISERSVLCCGKIYCKKIFRDEIWDASEMIVAIVVHGINMLGDIIFINNVFLISCCNISESTRKRRGFAGACAAIKTDVFHHIFHLSLSIIFQTSFLRFSFLFFIRTQCGWLTCISRNTAELRRGELW